MLEALIWQSRITLFRIPAALIMMRYLRAVHLVLLLMTIWTVLAKSDQTEYMVWPKENLTPAESSQLSLIITKATDGDPKDFYTAYESPGGRPLYWLVKLSVISLLRLRANSRVYKTPPYCEALLM